MNYGMDDRQLEGGNDVEGDLRDQYGIFASRKRSRRSTNYLRIEIPMNQIINNRNALRQTAHHRDAAPKYSASARVVPSGARVFPILC